jgi:hypothetical protein
LSRRRPIGALKSRTATPILVAVAVFLLLPHSQPGAFGTAAPVGQYSPASSWAIGAVVPENAPLSNGGTVTWENVSNVTVLLRLPAMNQTDGTIYAILSVMTRDGAILQMASGLLPNATGWGTYAMWIARPEAYPQEYKTLLEVNTLPLAPGALVTLSIYSQGGVWNFAAASPGAAQPIRTTLSANVSSMLKPGDQEVFALESYSTTSSVFADMGNMTLYSIQLDGQRVTGGWYLYGGGWNPSHNPLFVVGGSDPPSFMTAQGCSPYVSCWSFRSQWAGVVASPYPSSDVLFVLAGTVTIVVIALAIAMTKRRRRASF